MQVVSFQSQHNSYLKLYQQRRYFKKLSTDLLFYLKCSVSMKNVQYCEAECAVNYIGKYHASSLALCGCRWWLLLTLLEILLILFQRKANLL